MSTSSSALTPPAGSPTLSPEMVKALLQPNTAVVWPGQATFSSIQAAINSITDAGPDQQYQVFAGPGTYTEQVTLKPYVYLMGAGQDQTIITYGGTPQENGGATAAVVQGAPNSALQNLTVYCTGGPEINTYSQALYCAAAPGFYCDAVTLRADDSAGGPNASNVVIAVTNGYNSTALNEIKIGSSTLIATANGWGSGARAVNAEWAATYYLYNCQISATRNMLSTNGQAWAVLAGQQVTLQLTECTVSGNDYAINQLDGSATAIDCVLSGAVAPGVQVVNTSSTPA